MNQRIARGYIRATQLIPFSILPTKLKVCNTPNSRIASCFGCGMDLIMITLYWKDADDTNDITFACMHCYRELKWLLQYTKSNVRRMNHRLDLAICAMRRKAILASSARRESWYLCQLKMPCSWCGKFSCYYSFYRNENEYAVCNACALLPETLVNKVTESKLKETSGVLLVMCGAGMLLKDIAVLIAVIYRAIMEPAWDAAHSSAIYDGL